MAEFRKNDTERKIYCLAELHSYLVILNTFASSDRILIKMTNGKSQRWKFG